MTQLERHVKKAQWRLWLNRWFNCGGWCLAAGATLLAGVVMVQRAYDMPLPMLNIALGTMAAAVLASIAWCAARRASAEFAAAKLDEAAGLRERISSGRYCVESPDPFAQAVVADAERIASHLSVRQHLRFSVPRSLSYSGGALLLLAMMFLIPVGALAREVKDTAQAPSADVQQAKLAVKKRMEEVLKTAETNPALEDLKVDLQKLRDEPTAKMDRPDFVRHEAIKKIDTLTDAVKSKRDDPKYKSLDEFRRMTRSLNVPKETDAPTQKLAKALQEGDFKSASEEIKALQEQLATLKSDEDKELVEKVSKQLEELSKQLKEAAQDKQLEQKLEQAGIKKEDVQRMLENLSKQDLDQVRKQLEEKGFDQQQIEQVAKQLQQKQSAGSAAKQLAQSLQQAAQCNNPGQMGEAMSGLSQAGDQMSDMEALESEMNQLDAAMNELEQAKSDLSNPCSQCNGTGQQGDGQCPGCGGTGQCPGGSGQGRGGMGQQPGQGRGGLAQESATDVAFQIVRGQVKTTKGAIVGQFLVDGEQHAGETSSQLAEIVTAAERDATDAVTRDRVPRQYQKAVKEYFSNVQRSVKGKGAADGKDDGEESGDRGDGDKANTEDVEGTSDGQDEKPEP